jgi:hypothetical protein
MTKQVKQVNATATVIRSADVIRGFIKYGADDSAQFLPGSQVSADEMVTLLTDDTVGIQSKTERTVNTLRLARCLPEVVIPESPEVTDESGKVLKLAVASQTLSAFEYVVKRCRADARTKATFGNIAYMVRIADLKEAKGLKASIFTIKEAYSFLEEVKCLTFDKDGKPVLDLTVDEDGEAKFPVALALLNGESAGKVKEKLEAGKAARPDLYPDAATKAAAKAKEAADALKKSDTPDKWALDAKALLARFDTLVTKDSANRKALIAAGGETVKAINLLCGFDSIPVKRK